MHGHSKQVSCFFPSVPSSSAHSVLLFADISGTIHSLMLLMLFCFTLPSRALHFCCGAQLLFAYLWCVKRKSCHSLWTRSLLWSWSVFFIFTAQTLDLLTCDRFRKAFLFLFFLFLLKWKPPGEPPQSINWWSQMSSHWCCSMLTCGISFQEDLSRLVCPTSCNCG